MGGHSPITVLATSAGNDGFPAVLDALRSNGERRLRVVAVDVRPQAAGLYLADRSAVVPPRSEGASLVDQLLSICRDEHVDVLLPLSTDDQEFFADRLNLFSAAGVRVAVSPPAAVQLCNDKLALLEFASARGLACPNFSPVRDLQQLASAAAKFGFPERPIVLKLNRGTGARGVKIVHDELDPCGRMFDRNNLHVTMQEVQAWLALIVPWPPMHVCEYLPGFEYSVDVLSDRGQVFSVVVRLRLETLYGLALHARTVDEPGIARMAAELVQAIGLSYVSNVQIRRDQGGQPRLIELNPRIPGTIGLTVASGVNMPYLALKLALGEPVDVPPSVTGRSIMRYWAAQYQDATELLA